jgi:hypothetical protein
MSATMESTTIDPTAGDKQAITHALELIDRSLGTMHTRELVSSNEVSDLLLDMRSVLAASVPAHIDDLEPVAAN